jgi:D-hydroxyproline dehydrogenase subunit gamma
MIEFELDGRRIAAPAGVSVAAALLNAGVTGFRTSVSGEPRGPLCGMGTCQECRVTIDGVAQQRACLRTVRAGMRVATLQRELINAKDAKK